jgi:hypothetical protein
MAGQFGYSVTVSGRVGHGIVIADNREAANKIVSEFYKTPATNVCITDPRAVTETQILGAEWRGQLVVRGETGEIVLQHQ